MRFLYKTVGDKPPLGMQNIYVSWCEEDDEALEKIVDDIISSDRGSDCAVWYDFEPGVKNYDRERLSFMLERMHIAVFVVTNRMLTTPTRALNMELDFMRDHSVAVLPIFMEGTDVEEFYERVPGVGNGVFRDAENYKESLDGALNYLMCGKELTEEIRRNAFCGRINIITHPKDRKYLAGMQKMIHDFEFCRDFAVTCDDPFGIFQSEQLDMLRTIDQADVTLFTVTPNILQSSSNMATVLFPHMRDSKRRYIVVEAEETKPSKLASIYKHIPEPIMLGDEQRLRERLGDMIGSKSEGRDDPQHLYLIGNAYLYGIEAEVDISRGLHLITSAAKQGHYESQAKLVQMLSTGISAPIDLDSAVMWQKRVIEHETRMYNSDTSLDNAAKLAGTINELGALYERLNNPDKAANAYVNVASLCSRRLRNSVHQKLLVEYAKCCISLGKIKEQRHNIRGAEDDYHSALECYKKLPVGSQNASTTKESIAEISAHLGDICMARGLTEEAEAAYRRAYEHLEYLVDEAGQLMYRKELVACLDKMAQLYMSVDEFDCAEECSRMGCDITKRIAEDCGTINSLRSCSYSHTRLSAVLRNGGKSDEARKTLRTAIELGEKAFEVSDTDEAAMDLIAGYEQLCGMSHSPGEHKELMASGERILELRRELADRHRNDLRTQELLAETCIKVADFTDNNTDMRRLLEEAADIYNTLYKRTSKPEYRDLALAAPKHTRPNKIMTDRVRIRSRKQQ